MNVEAADSDRRTKYVRAAVLILIGAALFWFGVRPLLGRSDAAWEALVRQNSVELTQVLRPDPWVEDSPQIDAAWDKRRAQYDEEHLLVLRGRLMAYVDFVLAEWADAKNIYLSGRLPDKPTDNALAAQAKLKEAFGADADEMIKQFREHVREPAYKASPKVGGGLDPDLPRYDEMYDKLAADWLPKARARVERLTAPTR
jgi:hypothetical protein